MQPNQTFFHKNKKEIIITSIALIIFIMIGYFLFLNKKENISDSSVAELKQESSFFNNLFSSVEDIFDSNNDYTVPEENIEQSNYYIEGLIKIWSDPVAGYEFSYYKNNFSYKDEEGKIQTRSELLSKVLFVDSKSGYVYEKDLFAPTSTPIQISSSVYKNIAKAYFMNDTQNITSRIIMQYLQNDGTVKTITAKIPDYFGTPSKLIDITNLPDNIINISISPDAKRAIYLVKKTKTTNSKSDYYTDWYFIDNENDTYGKKIYSSELNNWKTLITNKGDIYAYQASTAFEESVLYKLDTSNNTLVNIYPGHTGIGFNLDENIAMISMFTGSGLKTFINQDFLGANFSDNNLSSLNFNTLSDKCAVLASLQICSVPKEIKNYDTGLPDAWYQGFTSWNDDLYVVNENYSYGEKLFDFKIDGEVYDTIDSKDLKINSLLTHLLFINKNDGSLWSLNIYNILTPDAGEYGG